MKISTYAYVRQEGDSVFGVDFPAFPGCISSGATLSEALHNARGALALHLKGMLEDGKEPPDTPVVVATITVEVGQ